MRKIGSLDYLFSPADAEGSFFKIVKKKKKKQNGSGNKRNWANVPLFILRNLQEIVSLKKYVQRITVGFTVYNICLPEY